MRIPMVAGNWKLNGTRDSAKALAREVAQGAADLSVEVVVCPVAVHMADVQVILKGAAVKLGAQNSADKDSGAFTGEISASMLAEFSCEYVIVGHSERRSIFAESDEQVARKYQAVIKAGLKPILCVGELLEERESGSTNAVIERQLDAVVDLLGVDSLSTAVIAYEPVWAIGTGKTASPEQAQEVHAFIRGKLAMLNADLASKLRILYGGSVKPENAAELFAKPDIDGGLIGGAALKSDDFLGICNAAGASK